MTLEFVGPLGVAFAASRTRGSIWSGRRSRRRESCSSPPLPAATSTLLGCALALLAGAFWAAYIVLSARVGAGVRGRPGPGPRDGARATVLLLAPGIADGGADLLDPGAARRRLRGRDAELGDPVLARARGAAPAAQGIFGVLMSLEPAVAATVGFIDLDQGLAARELVAIALVVVASAGALRTAPPPAEA